MRRLGLDAVVLANEAYLEHARVAYEDADEVFVQFSTDDELERLSRGRQVLVATHFQSMRSVAEVWDRRQDFLPVYYVQDYEPFFTVNVNGGAPESLEARSSYDRVPGMLRFAKTHWICNAVGRVRGLRTSPPLETDPLHRRSSDEALGIATGAALGGTGRRARHIAHSRDHHPPDLQHLRPPGQRAATRHFHRRPPAAAATDFGEFAG